MVNGDLHVSVPVDNEEELQQLCLVGDIGFHEENNPKSTEHLPSFLQVAPRQGQHDSPEDGIHAAIMV
jgi:hypothetical protein